MDFAFFSFNNFENPYCFEMARKMTVNRLDKDELEWELKLRGLKTGTTDEMRPQLSMALRLERSGESFRYPRYPFTFDEEEAAILKKCGDIEALLDVYSGSSNVSETQKLQTKLSHAMNRCDQMEVEGDGDKEVKKSELLTKLLVLYDLFKSKCDSVPNPNVNVSVPAALNLVTGNLAGQFATGAQNIPTSSPVANVPPTSVPRNSLSKMLPPHKWGLEKFCGTPKSLSITAFFERVEELCIARNVPMDVLLDSGVDLFAGKAYQFYKDVRIRVQTWEDLRDEFKREYLSAYHTDDLFDELRKRTQHSTESIGVYLAIMSSYFNRLGCPIPEEAKVSIILKNLHPFYQDRLRDPLPRTIDELRTVCRLMEDRRDAINSYIEPTSRRGNILERDLAFVDVQTIQQLDRLDVATTSSDKGKSIVCFRCKKPGHRAIGCTLPKVVRCFKCDEEGYTIRTCPKCNQGNDSRRS